MEKHPLQFFINLIEGKKIDEIRNSFFFVNPDKSVSAVNALEEYIEYDVFDDMHQQLIIDREYFKHFIAKFLTEKKVESLSTIDLHLLNNNKEGFVLKFITHIINTIDDLILQGREYSDFIKYPEIEEVMIGLKISLKRKYVTTITPTFSSPSTILNDMSNKLKWNAGVASLCTLFYELSNDYKIEKKGIPFLTASYDQLIKFVSANFVDEDGNPFSENSIKTYIDSRADKKAKRNRVEVNKIIPHANDKKQ